jgi:hypothetical protein
MDANVNFGSPRVAVIVPCYNAASTLAASLQSALMQDVRVEVVVVDDGSTDGSLAVARGFGPQVRVLTGPNRGASAARNIGMEATEGTWLVFLDADDLLEPGTLGKRLAAAEANGADVVICDWLELDDDGRGGVRAGARRSVDWPALEAEPELATAVHVWATTAAILYRRALVERIGGFRPDLPVIQDARLLFDAAYHGARFARADHVGARYRLTPGSLSRRDPARFWRDVLESGMQIEELWRARGDPTPRQREALGAIYNNAARALFAAESAAYFTAVERQRALNDSVPLHARIAAPLARTVGLPQARRILGWVGR